MSLCSVEEAAARVCAAANQWSWAADSTSFAAQGFELKSSRVDAEINPARNPGANDSEWICSIHLEGSPEDIGKQLAAIHALLNRPPTPPDETDPTFYGFGP